MRKLTVDECLDLGGHCWMESRITYPTNPPQYPQKCKHCTAKRIGTPQPSMHWRMVDDG